MKNTYGQELTTTAATEQDKGRCATALGSAVRAAEAYLAKCPDPMSKSDAASAVALVLVEAREKIARLEANLEAAKGQCGTAGDESREHTS
jgi:hypothetical protein